MSKKKKLEEQEKLKNMTKYDRKKYLNAKSAKKEKLKKIKYIAISLVSIAAVVGLILLAKDSQRRIHYETYATVGENEISSLEFEYYYYMNVNNWISSNYNYLSYYGIDLNKSLAEQIKDSKTNETWEDYFKKNTQDFVANVFSIYDDAVKNNFTDWKEEYDEFIANAKSSAKASNMEYLEYLKAYYGENITEKDFENYTKKLCMVTAYDNSLYENFEKSVTDKEIEDIYNKNKNEYDTVDYLMFTMSVDDVSKATDEDKKALKDKVTNAVSEIKNKDIFLSQAKIYVKDDDFSEKSVFNKAIGISNVQYSDCSKWLFDETRKEGDVISISNSNETTYYILYFINRKLDKEDTVNLRIIYQQFDKDVEDKDDDKIVTQEEAEKVIKDIADKYTLNGANENTFNSLATQFGFTDGGLNKYVSKDALLIDSISNWAFDEKREEADIKQITDDDVVYLVYYIGNDIPYYKAVAKNNISQEKYEAYIKEIQKEFKIKE
jgi:hypothetical protein